MKEISTVSDKDKRRAYMAIRAVENLRTNNLSDKDVEYLSYLMNNGNDVLKLATFSNLGELMSEATGFDEKAKLQLLLLKHQEILNREKSDTRKESRLTVDMINKYVSNDKVRDPSRFNLPKPSDIVVSAIVSEIVDDSVIDDVITDSDLDTNTAGISLDTHTQRNE